jgi:hypothetical protein
MFVFVPIYGRVKLVSTMLKYVHSLQVQIVNKPSFKVTLTAILRDPTSKEAGYQ